MKRIFLLLTLTSTPALAQKFYGGADFGSSFSDHGNGVFTGLILGDWRAEIGYGLRAKGNILGHPWSLATAWQFSSLYTKIGFSDYQGSGTRRVVFTDKNIYDVRATWHLQYASLGLGILRKLSLKGLQWGAETGVSQAMGGSVRSDEKADQSNLSEPESIVVDDVYFINRSAGIYARLFLQYELGAR